jgi:GNAT superfamily N-acetyltransferase
MSEEKIIDRIRKLLSLSKSANEHEAAQAAARAAELMLKHEIEEAQLGDEEVVEDVEEEQVDETGQRVPWKAHLQNGLALSMGCQMYTHRRYAGAGVGKMVCVYMIVGQPSKVATIKYMYQYLSAEVARLADVAYRQEHLECRRSGVEAPSARSWKNAFRLGAASTIFKRLMEQRKETHVKAAAAGQGTALVVVEKAQEDVAVFVKKHHPRMRQAAAASYSSGSGYSAGAKAGRGVGLGGGARLGAGARRLGSGVRG